VGSDYTGNRNPIPWSSGPQSSHYTAVLHAWGKKRKKKERKKERKKKRAIPVTGSGSRVVRF
jgi:hypothetical protein